MVGDQSGQGLVAVEVTVEGGHSEPERRICLRRRFIEIAARGHGIALPGERGDGQRQQDDSNGQAVFHGMSGLLLPFVPDSHTMAGTNLKQPPVHSQGVGYVHTVRSTILPGRQQNVDNAFGGNCLSQRPG
ncbi:hypothetical protein D9M72_564710 [compost metagenome]